jgi:hypothetical protein
MKRTTIALLLAAAVQPAFAMDTEQCSALASLTENTYVARLQRLSESDLLHELIKRATPDEIGFLQLTATTIEVVYDLPYNKLYEGGERELGMAVFENCIGEGI